MVTKRFIEKDFVYNKTNIQKNVLNVERYIDEAMLLYIEPQLGFSYTQTLYSNYSEGRVLEGTLEDYVLSYVQLALAYYTVSLILPNIHYKYTETSVIVKAGGDNEAVEGRDLQYLITLNKQNGDRFMDKALDIIKENPYSFPQFHLKRDNTPNNQYGSIIFKNGNKNNGDCGWLV